MNLTNAEIERLKSLLAKATPGPHQARFIFRMIRAVRKHATILGLMLQPDDTRDWADAELWAESANHLPALLTELQQRRKAAPAAACFVGWLKYRRPKPPKWLIPSAKALLELDASGSLVPHGIGKHARDIITEFLALHEESR